VLYFDAKNRGFSKMGLKWADIPTVVQEAIMFHIVRLEAEMNNVDVGILLWSLGSMDTPLDNMPG
jgi:hypothetical protein